jgi:hypothetical protein
MNSNTNIDPNPNEIEIDLKLPENGCAIPNINDIYTMVIILLALICIIIWQLRLAYPNTQNEILYGGIMFILLCILFRNPLLNFLLYTVGLSKFMRCQVTWQQTKPMFNKLISVMSHVKIE